MPELPEVETVVRTIASRLVGRRIAGAEFGSRRVVAGNPDEAAAALRGRKVTGVRRHGKFIVIELSGGRLLLVHLGMTGKLLMGGRPGPHTHAVLRLDRGALLYDDPRQFGRIEVADALPARLARLGPEPLEIALSEFAARLKRRKARMKAVLLDQTFLRGLGNIYADEALFRARIHPLSVAARLRRPRVERLYEAIREVLLEAIAAGGSSVSDYVDADGRKGFFQFSHRVYQRTGQPCLACQAAIRRVLVAQRGTHFCPCCQRR